LSSQGDQQCHGTDSDMTFDFKTVQQYQQFLDLNAISWAIFWGIRLFICIYLSWDGESKDRESDCSFLSIFQWDRESDCSFVLEIGSHCKAPTNILRFPWGMVLIEVCAKLPNSITQKEVACVMGALNYSRP